MNIGKKAFTLIELIIVVVLLLITAGIAVPSVVNMIDSWFFIRTEGELLANARIALSRMTKEIRQMKDTDSVTAFTSGQFTFSDLSDNAITYQQSGTSLMRNSDVLARKLDSLNGLTFEYLDDDGSAAADKYSINIVKVTLVFGTGGQEVAVRSGVAVRNR